MRAFGGPENLQIRGAPALAPSGADLLIGVEATSVNPIDWKIRQGLGLPRPLWRRLLGDPMILGLDFSGIVLEVGPRVRRFRVGDAVFGATRLCGAYSDRVVVREDSAIAIKPGSVSHVRAAVIPFAGRVALACLEASGITDWSYARILVIGASGGVGHLAVQLASRVFDAAHVAAICSARNATFVRDCGAHEVLPYDEISPEQIRDQRRARGDAFDLMVDAVGLDRYFRAFPSLLTSTGRYVAAALPASSADRPGEAAGPGELPVLLARLAARRLRGRYRLVTGLIGGLPGADGLDRMAGWLEAGLLDPNIHAAFDLADMAEAHRLSQTGRVVGKIAIRIG